ncbi:hypothetical protein [Agromyces humi]|uniref:hypothetical protein n=1 Tax=Agromyces humi TaxID=1766800 RepID=UPI001357EC89|nr:hypothetical protein [Agromyces humi]
MPEPADWASLLDQMEADYEFASAGRTELIQPLWQAPEHLGPIPDELRARAERLLSMQQKLHAELAKRRGSVARELRGIKAVPKGSSDQPVYLDIAG